MHALLRSGSRGPRTQRSLSRARATPCATGGGPRESCLWGTSRHRRRDGSNRPASRRYEMTALEGPSLQVQVQRRASGVPSSHVRATHFDWSQFFIPGPTAVGTSPLLRRQASCHASPTRRWPVGEQSVPRESVRWFVHRITEGSFYVAMGHPRYWPSRVLDVVGHDVVVTAGMKERASGLHDGWCRSNHPAERDPFR